MTARERALWPLAGVLLAIALAWNPFFERLDRAWQDFVLRQLAPAGGATASVVLDIDEASLKALRPSHGDWPLPRDLHAVVAQRLLDAGAQAVVFNLVFSGERAGDAALQALAEQSGRIVFGAAAAPAGDTAPAWPRIHHWQASPATPATRVEGLRGPDAGLLPTQGRAHLGMLTMPVDADGQLRCVRLLHQIGEALLPALPLAALALAPAWSDLVVDGGGREIVLGAHRWPVDARGCVVLRLAARADAVPALAYAAFATASPAAALAEQVRGRTVFVGSPSLLDSRVMTPLGQLGGTQWMALAHEALRSGAWMAPASPAAVASLFALALLPALLAALRARPVLRHELLAGALAVPALFALAWGLAAQGGQQAPLPAALLLLATTTLAGGWRWQRWLSTEREQARVGQLAAEAASRAKTQFLSHMSHEIRTPLNAVLGMSQLLAETPLTPTQRRYVEVFGSAGKHLRQLIEDLLDLSRVEAGSLQLSPQPFSPRALADELGALFTSRAQSQSLRFDVSVEPGLPDWVLGDAHRLRQILVNLLGNALKFTHEGGVSLALQRGDGAHELLFIVSDTGIGVPADKVEAIFEPFVQADGDVARDYGGSGLGLAITRRLVLAMGGSIVMHSEPGRGTEIRLRLPLPDCAAPPAEAVPAAHPGTERPSWPGRRLLLAEDHPHNVLVVQGMLADAGLAIDVAADGRSAVRMASETDYDLVLMDVQMPLLDGHAATREIRRAEQAAGRRPTTILALSANAMASDSQASLDAGCDGHLAKPLAKSTLLAALRQHLGAPAPAAPAPTVLDPEAAIERLGGNRALYAKVCVSARSQFEAWDASFDAAAAAGDTATCRRLAHDLKSIAGTVGAAPLQAVAATLELQCKEAGLPSAPLRDSTRQALHELLQRMDADAG